MNRRHYIPPPLLKHHRYKSIAYEGICESYIVERYMLTADIIIIMQ